MPKRSSLASAYSRQSKEWHIAFNLEAGEIFVLTDLGKRPREPVLQRALLLHDLSDLGADLGGGPDAGGGVVRVDEADARIGIEYVYEEAYARSVPCAPALDDGFMALVDNPDALAVVEMATGRRWTFAELAQAADVESDDEDDGRVPICVFSSHCGERDAVADESYLLGYSMAV